MRCSALLLVTFFLLFLLASPVLSGPGVSPDLPNVLGLYSSEDCEFEYIDGVNQFIQFQVYAVITNPINSDMEPVEFITGFECRVVMSPEILRLGTTYPPNTIDIGQWPDVFVGFGTPVPVIDDACLVATFNLMLTVLSQETITLEPFFASPSIPGYMAFLVSFTDEVVPMVSSSGDWATPDFGINTGPLWADGGQVVINPNPDFINAPWTLTNNSGFNQSGQGDNTFSNLDPDTYTILWEDVLGWLRPDPPFETLVLTGNESITFHADYSSIPVLTSVVDVPNDQGRQVRLIWDRVFYDSPGQPHTITEYGIYRRQAGRATSSLDKLDGWDYLASVPARGDAVYQFVAPTLCDSTINGGLCESTFMVSAETPSPLLYFDSTPVSGYSLDNLQPVMPVGFQVAFSFEANVLSWNSPTDTDVDHYIVYRDISPAFSGGEAIAQINGLTWTDEFNSGEAFDYFYWIVAVDHSGNTSDPTSWDTAQTSGIEDGVLPTRVNLYPAAPNPFNPMTTIRYELPNQQKVRLSIYGLDGRLIVTLVNEIKSAGAHHVVWTGQDNRGHAMASGTYVYRIEAGDIQMHRSMTLIK